MTDQLDTAAAQAWMRRFFTAFDREQEALSDLDRQSGDGDFGTNLRSALGRARKALDATDPATPGEVFELISTAFLHTGGTSGPRFGMWFRELAKAVPGPTAGTQEVAAGVTSGTATVQRLGGAKAGDKTMVDALLPAGEALISSPGSLADALTSAAAAARAGAESTAGLIARRGRASYVGEVSRGVIGPRGRNRGPALRKREPPGRHAVKAT